MYQVTLDKFEPFSETGKEYVDFGTLRILRKGRNNFVMSGNFSVNKPLGDEVNVRIDILLQNHSANLCFSYPGEMHHIPQIGVWQICEIHAIESAAV